MKRFAVLPIAFTAVMSTLMISCGNGNTDSSVLLVERLDSLMDAHYSADAPGAALLIAKNGEVLYDSGRGMADMEAKTPIDGNTAFNIASITKQFTAIGVLKLCEEGKLSLDDSVAKHFPEFKSDIWQRVKLRHLLSHSSGVPDARPRDDYYFMLHATDMQSIGYMAELDSLKFEPGSNYDYINPTFDLFYALIKKITGEQFEDYQKRVIFDVAGMENVQYFSADAKISNMAHGYIINEAITTSGSDSDYAKQREVSQIDYADSAGKHWAECDYGEETFFATKADGGIYTTTHDFLRWENALAQNKIVGERYRDMAYSEQTKVSGSKYCGYQNRENTFYGLGWFIDKSYYGDTKIYHTGDNGGFQAYACKYLKNKVNVIMFENRNDIDRWSTQLEIERILKEQKILE